MKEILDKLRVAIEAMRPKEERCGCVASPIMKSGHTHCGGHAYPPDKDLELVYHTLLSVAQDLERLSSDV